MHLLEPHRQLAAPAAAGVVIPRIQQLTLQRAPAWLRGIELSDDQLRVGNLVEPVEATLNGPDRLQLPVSCRLDLVVCGAKRAVVQAAGAGGAWQARESGRQGAVLKTTAAAAAAAATGMLTLQDDMC